MSKKRVHEIAKEFGVESKQVISILQQHNFNVTKAVNTVDDAGYTVVKNQLGGKSNGADTKAAASPANPSKHEKAATLNKAIKQINQQKNRAIKKRLNTMIRNMTIRNLMFVMYKLMSLLKNKIIVKNKMVVTIKNKIVQMVINKAKRVMVNKVKKMTTVTMVMQITATAMAV